MKIKVFRVGESPHLKSRSEAANDPKTMRGVHTHFTYEIFFVTEGSLQIVTEENTARYERSVVIIPPKINHYSVPSQKGSYCLLFAIENKSEYAHQAFLTEPTFLSISDDCAFYIRKLSEKLDENTAHSEKDAEMLVTLIFNGLIPQLFPKIKDRSEKKNDSKHISAIESYINDNLYNRITLSDIARHVYLSTRQISRIIAKEYGCSLSALVTDKKLAYAEMLLKKTDISISEIAMQTNIGSDNYFCTLFKRKYGISPLKYRKAKRSTF